MNLWMNKQSKLKQLWKLSTNTKTNPSNHLTISNLSLFLQNKKNQLLHTTLPTSKLILHKGKEESKSEKPLSNAKRKSLRRKKSREELKVRRERSSAALQRSPKGKKSSKGRKQLSKRSSTRTSQSQGRKSVPRSEAKAITSLQATKARTVQCKKSLGAIISAKSRTTILTIRNTGIVIDSRSKKVPSPGWTKKKPAVGNWECLRNSVSYSEKEEGNSTDSEEFIICTLADSYRNKRSLLQEVHPTSPNFDNYNIYYD